MALADAPQAIALGDRASSTSRFLAASIDLGLIFLLVIGLDRLLDLGTLSLPFAGQSSTAGMTGVLVAGLGLAFMAKFWSTSPGKSLLGLRIAHASSQGDIAAWQAAVRQALWFVSLLGGWAFLWMLCDRRGQGLHDKLARTVVVKV
ncbi:RDD family protein [Hyphobacterium sp.]|uniref:RDD family protein n=1 Tax=Hyphobacterium sp. TaxID=2004662 RepID=UPI0037497567